MNKMKIIQWIFGIILVLIAAVIIWNYNIFAEYNNGIATIKGIIGIGLIATSHIWRNKKLDKQNIVQKIFFR